MSAAVDIPPRLAMGAPSKLSQSWDSPEKWGSVDESTCLHDQQANRLGFGWSSSYQISTSTLPALYCAVLNSAGNRDGSDSQPSTVLSLQSWPSLHRVGVMNV